MSDSLEEYLYLLTSLDEIAHRGDSISSGVSLHDHYENGLRRDIEFRHAVPLLVKMINKSLEMAEVLSHKAAFLDQFNRILRKDCDSNE